MRRTYAATVALAFLATACTGGGDADPKPTGRGSEPVPLIATDPCPEPQTLLAEKPKGDNLLPDVELKCLGHEGAVAMRSLGGRPYVVNIWAAWCGPCRTEMPEFQKVYVDLKDRVGFLGVNTKDFDREARSAVQRAAISYPSVVDVEEKIRRAVNARTVPATIFVAVDGTIADVHVGQMTEAELRAAIRENLGVE
jgi:thiol-disulfide isomerase/thioredoxin